MAITVTQATKGGVAYHATGWPVLQFEFDSLAAAGWIRVTHCGDENVYFDWTDDAGTERKGYCKCL